MSVFVKGKKKKVHRKTKALSPECTFSSSRGQIKLPTNYFCKIFS